MTASSLIQKALLYFFTIRRMKSSMIISRLRGRRRVAERILDGDHNMRMPNIAIPELDINERYLMRFDVEGLLTGDFLLLNECHKVDLNTWNVPEASHLWNFNLHYFEWGIALAARWRETNDDRYLDCYKFFVYSWLNACPYMQGDAWHPYTISLRIMNWLITADLFDGRLQEDGELFPKMRESMYRQYRHLLINQEMHLRANHWWENLKTLVIAAAVFGEQDVLVKISSSLEEQLDEQILPDGVHFERSLMYHKLVLEGLLRVYVVSDQLDFELPENFIPKAKLMLDAIASLERGMGKTPFFNDSADGVAKECVPLVAACERLLGMKADETKTAFSDAGYYKLYDGDIALMIDAGEPGPTYMLGHAHCDCLSFELSYNNRPVIVNSGTYAYQSELRSYFRSTTAHNTCMLDDEEQLECWGEHRVARSIANAGISRLNKTRAIVKCRTFKGRNYQRDLSLHRDILEVRDYVNNVNGSLVAFVHFAPGFSIRRRKDSVLVTNSKISLVLRSKDQIDSSIYSYSPEFGAIEEAAELVQISTKNDVLTYSIKINKEESVVNND